MNNDWEHKMRKPWQFMGAQDIGAVDDPYISRLRIIASPLFSIYLHHIHREDKQPQHDHPWPFLSLVLTGSYVEQVYPDKHYLGWFRRENKRWSVHRVRVRQAHKITQITKPLWTLVFTGPVVNPRWGFYPGGKYKFWQEYEGREDVTAGWPSWKEENVSGKPR